ncbi:MAG TPA: prepilin-type N-terminal cleavage/methylation domain-containing protein [Sedimentisphaerales bacterium]|nr:prepilin-type N-terminal cleavage/methylation domain-containing protein [Sedimentisphaerales bacterium]
MKSGMHSWKYPPAEPGAKYDPEYTPGRACGGFTVVELLVVIGILAVLTSVLLGVVGSARRYAKAVVCMSNLRQLGVAFALYGNDYDNYAMPLAGQSGIYWWGQKQADGIDHTKGFVWPYLQSELSKNSVYECPSQRYGSYGLQGKPAGEPDDPKWITSTYGYNGYYLCPQASGWGEKIKDRPWQKITTVKRPALVIAFADTLINLDSSGKSPILRNTALLDPPYLYNSSGWEKNLCPTTCFRHKDRANAVFVDGHCEGLECQSGQYVCAQAKIGSVSKNNSPYYVPDYASWPTTGRKKR